MQLLEFSESMVSGISVATTAAYYQIRGGLCLFAYYVMNNEEKHATSEISLKVQLVSTYFCPHLSFCQLPCLDWGPQATNPGNN